MEIDDLNIEALPSNILVKIFENLDSNTLVDVSKVCQRWFNLITSSHIMDKFELIIFVLHENFKIFNQFPLGQYRRMFIGPRSYSTEIPETLFEFVAENCGSIQKITLKDLDDKTIIKILKLLPQLKEIRILRDSHTVRQNYGNQIQDLTETLNLPNLQSLELIDARSLILFIKCDNIKSLKIHRDSRIQSLQSFVQVNQSSNINYALKSLIGLKNLTISTIDHDLELKCEDFSFQLENLILDQLLISNQNLLRVLNHQKESLKSLSLAVKDVNEEVLKFLLFSMSLEELEIDIESIPNKFSDSKTNLSLKKLTIRMTFDQGWFSPAQQLWEYRHGPEDLTQTRNFQKSAIIFSCCKSIESVSIFEWINGDGKLISSLSLHVPELKILKLSSIPNLISPADTFDNLSQLEVDKIHNKQDFKNFTLFVIYLRNLKSFKINLMHERSFDETYFINAIEKVEKLEKIQLGMKFEFTPKIMEAIYHLKVIRRPLKEFSVFSCDLSDERIRQMSQVYFYNTQCSFFEHRKKFFQFGSEKCRLGRIEVEMNEKDVEIWKWKGIVFKNEEKREY